jgi:glutamate racemase
VIGVFDSGSGGLSVLVELRKLLPKMDLLYVADRARAPYGTRTLAEVEAMALDVAEWLVDRGASTLVVACNTASAAALDSIRARLPAIPVVGMEPAVKLAASSTRSGVVAVLATSATFQGKLFATAVDRHATTVEVHTRVCPQWVDLVEAGSVDGPQVEAVVRRVVVPLIEVGADTLVLGCTHFSFLRPVIERVAGPDVEVIDPAPAVAAQTARVAAETNGTGSLAFAVSGNFGDFAARVTALTDLGTPTTVLPFPA